jgi:hypothetical protein
MAAVMMPEGVSSDPMRTAAIDRFNCRWTAAWAR